MNISKTGDLIRKLRVEKGLTQRELADLICVSYKAVSKWECGNGMPDLSILPNLSKVFETDILALLNGEMEERDMNNGNMKNICFYVCPECGNIITSLEAGDFSCCSRKLEALKAIKALDEEKLTVETNDGELLVTAEHSMEKDGYISFISYVSSDTLIIKKLYPQWGVNVRFPFARHGVFYFYDTKKGLLVQRF